MYVVFNTHSQNMYIYEKDIYRYIYIWGVESLIGMIAVHFF